MPEPGDFAIARAGSAVGDIASFAVGITGFAAIASSAATIPSSVAVAGIAAIRGIAGSTTAAANG